MKKRLATRERIVRRGSRQVVYAPAADEAPKQPLPWRVYLKRAGLTVVSVGLLWTIFFSGWLNVRSIRLHGEHALTNQAVADDVQKYFERFPTQRNILFLQTTELADYIRTAHPTLEKVNINRTVLLGINVLLKETQPAMIWQSGTKFWLIGEDGRVLREAEEGDVSFGRVIDAAQVQINTGDKVADEGFVSFVREVYRIAQEKNIELDQVFITDTTRELNLKLKTGVTIKMAVERGAGEQMEAYQSTIETAARDNVQVKEYVDVRVIGKTYYK